MSQDGFNPEEQGLAAQLRLLVTSHFYRQRGTKQASLNNLRDGGFKPTLVIDVGAQVGTPELSNSFPDAHHVLIEPVAECLPALQQFAAQLKSVEILQAAVSDRAGTTHLSVTPSRQYSSIEAQLGDESRLVVVVTVDSLLDRRRDDDPLLLKVDVDGIELKVVQGAQAALAGDCIVVVEATLGDESPRFNRVVQYLSDFGFDVYDIIDLMYRRSDFHVWQVDLVFVKQGSALWGKRQYAS